MAKGLESALRPGLHSRISILGSVRRGFGRIVETYCRTIRLSPGKSIITCHVESSTTKNINTPKIIDVEILYGLWGNIVGAILGFSCAASTVLHKKSKNQNRKRGHFYLGKKGDTSYFALTNSVGSVSV